MKRPWHIWIGFAVCLVVVLAAMGWISLSAVRLDREAAEAHRQAAREENIRLALWRMDWTLAPLVAQESARPYFVYSPFLPIDRAFSRMFNERGAGESLIASPLMGQLPPGVLVHFQFGPDGQLSSPQVPIGANFDLAVPEHTSSAALANAATQLARLREIVDRDRLLAILPERAPEPVAVLVSPLDQNAEQQFARQQARQSTLQAGGRSAVEFEARNEALQFNNAQNIKNNTDNPLNTLLFPSTDVAGVPMTPLWVGGQLILARRVSAGGREYVQGCLLDWPAIKASLLGSVDDLLPAADLEPVQDVPPGGEARMLAALPARLIPGAVIPGDPAMGGAGGNWQRLLSPIVLSLAAAWACALLAAAAVAALLMGLVRLSQRRADFVTAVTHELRTPLTTFQMYAEMLAEGMVPDTAQQKRYLATLRAEAVRLTHMVENVLCYARLERGRADGRLERLGLGQLVGRIEDRLAGRAEQAGMQLVVQSPAAAGAAVRANVSAAEQILFNLVDNACKYAADAEDKRIELTVESANGRPQLRLRDHGPGLSPSARRQLFQPFSKSAHEAAHTAPGVGLGLALSRRLARHMGGDLRLDEEVTDGACFVLTLPPASDGAEGHQP